jgi:glycosyltransferase involved in cell wall biosynthesis
MGTMESTEQPTVARSETNADETASIRTSIVLPAYNEVDNVAPLVDEILNTFLDESEYGPIEIVVVDDGSTDGTRQRIRELAESHATVIGVFLSRNFGQSAALSAGIERAAGEYIVPMDADRQNDPADIPKLLDKLDEGYDCVSGWRRDRDDPFRKTIPSAVQTKLARWTGPDIHDFGCTLKTYRADALQNISLYGERHRYIPAQLYSRGYRITELPVNHRPRTEGQTKYGPTRLLKGFVDLLFYVLWNRYSTSPMHLLGGAGLLSFTIGVGIGLHAVVSKYVFGQSLLTELPRLILTVALILFGVLLLMFGFLAEMMTIIHYEDREPYHVERVLE